MKAVLLVSHGSHSPKTKKEVSVLVEQLKMNTDARIFEYAFLEIESPSIPEGIDICVQKGACEVLVLLNFLNSGRHIDEDIPKIILAAKIKYPKVQLQMSPPVGQHEKIKDIFFDFIASH